MDEFLKKVEEQNTRMLEVMKKSYHLLDEKLDHIEKRLDNMEKTLNESIKTNN